MVSLEASNQVLTSKEATSPRKVGLDNVIIVRLSMRAKHPPKSLLNAVAIELLARTRGYDHENNVVLEKLSLVIAAVKSHHFWESVRHSFIRKLFSEHV